MALTITFFIPRAMPGKPGLIDIHRL